MAKPSFRYWKTSLALALLALAAGPAWAWGPLGHKAVAIIAQKRLSPKALQQVRDILGADVGLDKIANCADEMFYVTEPLNCGGAFLVPPDPYKKTQAGHYLSIPITQSPAESSLMKYCPKEKSCVLEQIYRHAQIIGNKNASLEKRRLALMFLVHFVADEHHPLHCAGDDDWGGNAKPVTFHGKEGNLHSLWDGMVRVEAWNEDPSALVARLEAEIAAEENAALWTRGNYASRAVLEGFDISKHVIYPQYDRDRGRNLGKAYEDKMQPIARRRVAMAAVRLADLLEKALGGSQAPDQETSAFKAAQKLNTRLQSRDLAVKFD